MANFINTNEIVGYWCEQVQPLSSSRFESYADIMLEIIDDKLEAGASALERLALSAPAYENELLAFFAAGDLENYINKVVELKDQELARHILQSASLRPLLEWVWTKEIKEQLVYLSQKTKYNIVNKIGDTAGVKIESSYTINQLTAFWCNEFCSRFLTLFDTYADAVRYHCENISNPNLVHDLEILLSSAPDELAVMENFLPIFHATFERVPRASKIMDQILSSKTLAPLVQG